MKPKITISNFAGMGQGGSYYLDGMRPHKLGNESILTTGHTTNSFCDEDDTNMTGFLGAPTMTQWSISNAVEDEFIITLQSGGEMFLVGAWGNEYNIGEVHDISTTPQSSGMDLYITSNDNILYTSSNLLGIGRHFTATGGSTTTFVVSGEDFATNYPDLAAGDKIYNITKGEEYTIDTAGVGSTTLTVVTGTAVESGDEFIVFDDNAFDFGTTSIVNNHFGGQSSPATWVRQIKLAGDDYWILNGNYIASLNIDEATFAAEAKQLPYQHQATCMDVNQQNILIGASYRNYGKLLLWDTYSNGWLSIMELSSTPMAIKSYKSGWIVVAQNAIYYTNGYELQLLSEFPDSQSINTDDSGIKFNGIEILNEKIYLALGFSEYSRNKTGVWTYSPKDGWGYAPLSTSSAKIYEGTIGGFAKWFNGSNITLFVSGYDTEATNSYVINNVVEDRGTKYSALLYVKLPQKMRISKFELNLGAKYNRDNSIAADGTVTVSYGDGNDMLWKKAQVGSGSTTTSIVTGTGSSFPAKVGQEVKMLQGDSGGETTWITAITNAGEANETWTVSPALSNAPTSGTEIAVLDVKKSESKTIDPTNITKSLDFNVSDFYSDKLFVEIMFNINPVQLDLHSINIY